MQTRTTLALALLLLAAFACKREEKPAGYAKPGAQTAQPAPTSTAPGADVGAIMPEYTALQLDGSKYDLATKRDKVVLINVWATWCGPCRYEIPELQKLHEAYGPRGVEILGVSVDESGAQSVKEFIAQQQKMTYPVVLDAEGKIANILQTSVLPTSVVVDKTGKIVWKKYGAILEGDEELKKVLDAAI
jgi:cytochrome c biogenesis protein CcmG, thiol:disulfide interchange protein DsbE